VQHSLWQRDVDIFHADQLDRIPQDPAAVLERDCPVVRESLADNDMAIEAREVRYREWPSSVPRVMLGGEPGSSISRFIMSWNFIEQFFMQRACRVSSGSAR
jgi:hypothetical protein